MAKRKPANPQDSRDRIYAVEGFSSNEVARLAVLVELYRQNPRELPESTLESLTEGVLRGLTNPEPITATLNFLEDAGYISFRYRSLGAIKIYSLRAAGVLLVEREYSQFTKIV